MLTAALVVSSLLCLPAAPQAAPRFDTDRPTARVLPLPKEEGVFHFVVYGDRTGGPAEGIHVLEQAVKDTNLLAPDLVMTVGDLIQGYNQPEQWMAQMREFRAVMEHLRMPWFPVAGNHDTYWRGPNRPRNEHDDDFERHFGPLWYSFEHKNCRFVSLYTDEGDPADDGKKSFAAGPGQRMSDAQLGWLAKTLQQSKHCRHVFLFLHHPRWIEARYGDDWRRVHDLLRAAGNVTAVFAGHIHRVRYDGLRDGIEYFTAATVGGHLNHEDAPQAGYLHHVMVVTVRNSGIAVANVPVGAVADPRHITGAVSDDLALLMEEMPVEPQSGIHLDQQLAASGRIEVVLKNPVQRPIEVTLTAHDADGCFGFLPDHVHRTIAPGGSIRLGLAYQRQPHPRDPWFRLPELTFDCDYLAEHARFRLPTRQVPLTVRPSRLPPSVTDPQAQGTLHLADGGHLRIEHEVLALPQGPFTVEAWVRAPSYRGRRALINKTEGSEFGLFVSDGRPSFMAHLGGSYRSAQAPRRCLQDDTWHHVAGVVGETFVALYVDGREQARIAIDADLPRKTNQLPLMVGADPDGDGRATSQLTAEIDEVRISRGARYGTAFEPARRLLTDDATQLLLHLDLDAGPWAADVSGHDRHALRAGDAHCR